MYFEYYEYAPRVMIVLQLIFTPVRVLQVLYFRCTSYLGELAECEVAPVVVVVGVEESGLKIGAIAASESLDLLCDRLEAAENGSSFDIAAEICREKGQMR